MSDFVKKMMYLVTVTYQDSGSPEFVNYEEQYFNSFREAERAAWTLEDGEDPWYGDDVIVVDVDPEPVEVFILQHDHSGEKHVEDPVPKGRAL